MVRVFWPDLHLVVLLHLALPSPASHGGNMEERRQGFECMLRVVHAYTHPLCANCAALLQHWQPTSSLLSLHRKGPKHQCSVKQGQ